MAALSALWDISHMKSRTEKKAESERRAKEIYRRLMSLPRDPSLSNNAWAERAGVSTSFFTNLGAGKRPPSEPSIGNLRAVLEAVGSSIPEFFAHEAQGRLVQAPNARSLGMAIRAVLPGLPRSEGKRAEYLAEAVLDVLGLPSVQPATPDQDSGDPEEAALPPAPTTQAESGPRRKSGRR